MHLTRALLGGFLILLLLVTAGCTNSSPSDAVLFPSTSPIPANTTVDRVEVIHFHGNNQCISCIAVGNLAEETVKEYFPRELASGKLSFRHVNFDDTANKNIVASYGITGSSLWITMYDANGVHRLQDLDVWYLTGDKERSRAYLASVITRRLGGDLA
ncbi:MAG: nitrophenyl compound nitroreductase subunit ArsF family protein [Methanomicrobiales archaeon]